MKQNNQAFAAFIDKRYIPLQRKHKIAGAATLLALSILLFFFVFYQPKSKEIIMLTQTRDAAAQELQKAEATAATIEKHRGEMAALREQFDATAVLFPKEKEIPRLLTDISAEGQNAGLEFLSFRPQAAVPQDFYSDIPIDIQVRGLYHDLGSFLDHVSKLSRIVSVSNVRIGSPQKKEGEMLLDSSCRLVTYQFTNRQLAPPPTPKK
jgi:type IV pilus assembly protein PilO